MKHQHAEKIINGNFHANSILEKVQHEIAKRHIQPGLAVIQVGNDPASTIYVRNKRQCSEHVGIKSFNIDLPSNISEDELITQISALNENDNVHGILVQLPLPKHLNTQYILDHITPTKDVDVLTSTNLGKIINNHPDRILPCTPKGILYLLNTTDSPIKGKHVVIIGASAIVGKPLAMELCELGATVTLCHEHTENIARHIAVADIVISAIGKPNIIQTDWLNPACIVIDIGINRLANGIVGDINFPSAVTRVRKITPVPGGVGPMTVAMLMQNTLLAYDHKL